MYACAYDRTCMFSPWLFSLTVFFARSQAGDEGPVDVLRVVQTSPVHEFLSVAIERLGGTKRCNVTDGNLRHGDLVLSTPRDHHVIRATCNINEGRKEMFYLTTHSTHFIYGYIASDIW